MMYQLINPMYLDAFAWLMGLFLAGVAVHEFSDMFSSSNE